MSNEFVKLKKLEAEYSCLLKLLPQGEEIAKVFESKSVPMEKTGEHITFLENEIIKLKEELLSDGVDVDAYLKNNNSLD